MSLSLAEELRLNPHRYRVNGEYTRQRDLTIRQAELLDDVRRRKLDPKSGAKERVIADRPLYSVRNEYEAGHARPVLTDGRPAQLPRASPAIRVISAFTNVQPKWVSLAVIFLLFCLRRLSLLWNVR